MLIRIFLFHLVTVVAFNHGSRSVDEKLKWLRSVHLKDSENNQTASNKLHAGAIISRTQSATSALKHLDTVPQPTETVSSTTGRVAEIGHGNGEVIEPRQEFTPPRSTILNYLLTWKRDGLPFTPDSVTSTTTSETTVTSVSGIQTNVINSSDGMLVDQWHRSLILKNEGDRAKVTIANSEDTSKMHTTEAKASSYTETRVQAHTLNSIDEINTTFTFQNSRLHDMISITKFIIVTATVSCAVIVILALIFGISSCRKKKVTLRDVNDHGFQKTDSDLLKVIPHEDKGTYMGIPSNNQIWKELQIIENSAAIPSVITWRSIETGVPNRDTQMQ